MNSENQVTVWKSVKDQFDALSSLSKAADEIKSKTEQGTINAYIMIVSHLGVSGAEVGKKDKVAKETFEELLKLKVNKAKARRFIELSQGYRRYAKEHAKDLENIHIAKELESNSTDDIKFCFAELGVINERKLKLLVLPNQKKEWWESAAKHIAKEAMKIEKKAGESASKVECTKLIGQLHHEAIEAIKKLRLAITAAPKAKATPEAPQKAALKKTPNTGTKQEKGAKKKGGATKA